MLKADRGGKKDREGRKVEEEEEQNREVISLKDICRGSF